MPYELAKLMGCTRISKSKSHREDILPPDAAGICDLFIPAVTVVASYEIGFMCENMSPGFKKGLPRGLANMWCNPACPRGRKV